MDKNPLVMMPYKEAAEIMGISEQAMRAALQQGLLPFGVAIKLSEYVYYVNRKRFELWMEGKL